MRIALILALALSAAGCAKKQKPAATPAATESKAADEAAPGGGSPDAADTDQKTGTGATGDPCDGGETKAK